VDPVRRLAIRPIGAGEACVSTLALRLLKIVNAPCTVNLAL